jgi:antitoxin (DNA-binding transcriptional repressor) of toxin-antitoxin stability system
MGEPTILVGNGELVTVRDAMRVLNRIVDRIESGEIEKAVLTRKGRMVAVVVPLSAIGKSTDV